MKKEGFGWGIRRESGSITHNNYSIHAQNFSEMGNSRERPTSTTIKKQVKDTTLIELYLLPHAFMAT